MVLCPKPIRQVDFITAIWVFITYLIGKSKELLIFVAEVCLQP